MRCIGEFATGGREISAILLTVVGDGSKNQKYIYNMGSKLDKFSQKKVFLVQFCSRRTAHVVRNNAKKFTSIGLSFKDVILLNYYVFDVVYLKSNGITR